jgi:adenylosuccinate synthase
MDNCEPIYEEMRGWKQSTSSAKKLSQLPRATRDYVKRIGQLTGAKVSIVSVGPMRSQTIFL